MPGPKVVDKPDVLSPEGMREWMEDASTYFKSARDQGLKDFDRRVDEYLENDGQIAGSMLTLALGVAGPWTLTSIIVIIPVTATSAFLTIGKRKIPVQQTPFFLGPVTMLLDPNDHIGITWNGGASPSPTFIEAMGYENGPLT